MIEKKINEMGFIVGAWPFSLDRPTLVFISGAGANAIFWKDQVAALSDVANTMAVDLPGHGASGGKAAMTLYEYASAVNRLIETIDAPLPVPCGVSMGGGVVLELLIGMKNRFAAGIVINSAAKLPFFPIILEILRKNKSRRIDYHRLFSELAISTKSDLEKMRVLIDGSATLNPQVSICDISACNGFDVTGALHEIRGPVLVIVGSDDVIIPPSNGHDLTEKISRSQLVQIADAGHLAPIEKPAEINRAIRRFLSDHGLSPATHPFCS